MSVPESERNDPVPGTSTRSQNNNTSEEASSLPHAFKLLKEVNTDVIMLSNVSKNISQLFAIFQKHLKPEKYPKTLKFFENQSKEMGDIVDRVVAQGVELVLIKKDENYLSLVNHANEKINALVDKLKVLKKSKEESKQSKKYLEMELEDLRKVNEGLVTANKLLKKLSIVREQAEEMARQSKMIEDLKRENESIRNTLEEETVRRILAETKLNNVPEDESYGDGDSSDKGQDKNVVVKVSLSKAGKKQQKDHFSLATSRRLRSATAKIEQGQVNVDSKTERRTTQKMVTPRNNPGSSLPLQYNFVKLSGLGYQCVICASIIKYRKNLRRHHFNVHVRAGQ